MKNLFVSLLIFIGMFSNLSAQKCDENCKKKDQIKAQKVAFITDKLQLTVDEAQQFWPIYNEMDKKSNDIENQIRTIVKNYKTNKETLSNSELETMSDKMVELQVNSAKLDAEYYQKFKKVLSIRKIMELNQAEREFKHELLQKLKGCSATKE
jgi:hypothetical protein